MSEFHVVLTPNERALLVRMLTDELKHKRVEVRRTEFSREFRHQVEAEEAQVHALLEKLSHTAEVE
jgi:hypothetical protein